MINTLYAFPNLSTTIFSHVVTRETSSTIKLMVSNVVLHCDNTYLNRLAKQANIILGKNYWITTISQWRLFIEKIWRMCTSWHVNNCLNQSTCLQDTYSFEVGFLLGSTFYGELFPQNLTCPHKWICSTFFSFAYAIPFVEANYLVRLVHLYWVCYIHEKLRKLT